MGQEQKVKSAIRAIHRRKSKEGQIREKMGFPAFAMDLLKECPTGVHGNQMILEYRNDAVICRTDQLFQCNDYGKIFKKAGTGCDGASE